MKRTPLGRKVGLNRGEASLAKRRKRLNPVGRRKRTEIDQHGKFRKEYLENHPWCEAGPLLLSLPDAPKCGGHATELHERLARSAGGDKHLSCPGNLVRACRPCHRYVTDHPTFASVAGLYLRREHELQGPHAPDCRASSD